MRPTTTPKHPHESGLRDWLETLEVESTKTQYRRHIEGVLAAGGGQLTAEGFVAFRDAEYRRGLSLGTIGAQTAAVRGFARYLADSGLMTRDELAALWDVPRLRPDLPPAPVTVNDGFIGRMAAAAMRSEDDSPLRVLTDRAAIVLLGGCGLRAAEAVAVQWLDYDSGSATSKGGGVLGVLRPSGIVIPRTLEVAVKNARVLDELRERHRTLVAGPVDEAPILAGLWDSGLSAAGLVRPFRPPGTQMLEDTVDRLAQRAGALPGEVHSSQLRDVCAERLQRAGLEDEEIAYRLGNAVV